MGPGAGGATGLVGLANSPALTNGKIKGFYIGISFTQDIEIQAGLHCPDSAKEALADVERAVASEKGELVSKKSQVAQLMGMLPLLGLGDLIPQIESTVNSLSATGAGSVVQMNVKIPGGIATTIEKAVPAIMGMAAGQFGGNPFGGMPPTDGTPDDAGAPTGDEPPASQNP